MKYYVRTTKRAMHKLITEYLHSYIAMYVHTYVATISITTSLQAGHSDYLSHSYWVTFSASQIVQPNQI